MLVLSSSRTFFLTITGVLTDVLVNLLYLRNCPYTCHAGYRLKQNADLICYEPGGDHEKAVQLAMVSLGVGGLGFAWLLFQPWWLFTRRAPKLKVDAHSDVKLDAMMILDGATEGDADVDAGVLDGDANGEAPLGDVLGLVDGLVDGVDDIGVAEEEVQLPVDDEPEHDTPEVATMSSRFANAMHQVGLDPRTRSCNRCCRKFCARCCAKKTSKERNIYLHTKHFDDTDGVLIAFAAVFDSDIKPHVFWFGHLQGTLLVVPIEVYLVLYRASPAYS